MASIARGRTRCGRGAMRTRWMDVEGSETEMVAAIGSKATLNVIINPEITVQAETDDYILEEGCLSFPEIRGDVIRPDGITAKFQDQHGVPHVLVCDGLLARCIQHEADHLNGILFIDRMEKPVRNRLDKAVKELARQTKETARPA